MLCYMLYMCWLSNLGILLYLIRQYNNKLYHSVSVGQIIINYGLFTVYLHPSVKWPEGST